MLRALSIRPLGQILVRFGSRGRLRRRIPDVVEATRSIELVRVDVQRDAGTRVAKLARCTDGIDACPDQMAGEGVAQVVEPKLRHVMSVQIGRRCRVVEAALGDVVSVERLAARCREHVRVDPRQPGSRSPMGPRSCRCGC